MNTSETLAQAVLPRTIEELTPEWLGAALSIQQPGTLVNSVTQTGIIWGSATKVFAQVEYEKNPAQIPNRLCIKGGFDERSRAFGLGPAYELEGCFYRDLSPVLQAEHPDSFYAAAEKDQGVVILEDLNEKNADFAVPTRLWSVDDVAATLEVMAGWHGPLTGSAPGRFPWLPVGAEAARRAFDVMLSPEQFHILINRDEVPDLSPGLRDDERIRRAFRALWEYDDSAAHTINHGDAHFGQLYRIPGEAPAFLDWQTACLAPWGHDVAYFLGSALTVADRRTHERELLAHYTAALAAADGPTVDADEAWAEYRRHILHGFAWMCVPTVMQPAEVVSAMTERYAAAIDDLDPFELLFG
ncbi:phosphotransferase [Nocardia jinanensis]|uniref:CHK kinase-like domain-containing protein n=1 Tax=Nocardia jinanensis TaxID=382504 RepID=A0A917RMN7_9NOCA|nr:phosphotransferase [Nocardia jinanensis]GGL14463.1 hypothetical protein GCM10011588_31240 [Nocardia jinanensis]